MPKLYDADTLSRVKACELEILKDFIKVCEENNLTYFGFWGTGIGALRHGGFIPWDDDIDLLIPRADYNKAMEVFKKDFSDKYTVVNAEEYNDFPGMNTHIILNDSSFVTTEELRLKYPKGIFLDIFPLDNAPADEKVRNKKIKKAWILSKLLILKHIPFPHVPFKGVMGKLCHCATAVVWFLLNLFCISHKFLYNSVMKVCTEEGDKDTGYYAYYFGNKMYDSIFKKEELFPLRKIAFEGIDICFPNNLEEGLTISFGDFMKLPPLEKRVNHCPDIIEFPKGM